MKGKRRGNKRVKSHVGNERGKNLLRERRLTGESQNRKPKAIKKRSKKESRAHTRGWGLGGLNVNVIL